MQTRPEFDTHQIRIKTYVVYRRCIKISCLNDNNAFNVHKSYIKINC